MFDSAIYKNRRQALRNKVQNGLILILGNNEAPANYPVNYQRANLLKRLVLTRNPSKKCTGLRILSKIGGFL